MSEGKPRVPEPSGCGCGVSSITITITPTTGGQFDVTVDRNESIDNLKKIISKRLKVAKERICLLHRERQLRDGTLEENRLMDGSRLTLLPSVETGLLAQRPEQSVMQALESLSDSQVNDFLSGKAPLNLTMRLGDHMMLIQLQLSTVTPAAGTATSPAQVQAQPNTSTPPAAGSATTAAATSSSSSYSSSASSTTNTTTTQSSSTSQPNPEISHNSPVEPPSANRSSNASSPSSSPLSSSSTTSTSPSKLSLCSSLVDSLSSSSTNSSLLAGPSNCCTTPTSTVQQQQQPPPPQQQPQQQQQQSSTASPGSNSRQHAPLTLQHRHPSRHRHLHPTRHLYHHYHHHHYHHHYHHHHLHRYAKKVAPAVKPSCTSCSELETTVSTDSTSKCSEFSLILGQCDCTKLPKKKPCSGQESGATSDDSSSSAPTTPTTPNSPASPDATTGDLASNPTATFDTRALVEASRNLTQKLKQLSSEENAKRRQGAIIESMHHHGKGVYTGTFSGTLNPALQDRHGRPKRDISTIIHILNDLLCATPATTAGHYRYHRHPSGHRTSTTSLASSTTASQSSSMFALSSSGPTTTTTSTSSGALESQPDSPNPGYSSELSKENEATKGKMRRLRLVMEQRREKMRARRQARAAPYTTKWAAVTPDPDPNASSSSSASSSPTKTTSDPQNEPELQPCSPEPVVA